MENDGSNNSKNYSYTDTGIDILVNKIFKHYNYIKTTGLFKSKTKMY